LNSGERLTMWVCKNIQLT